MGVKEEKKPKKSRSLTRPRSSITIPPFVSKSLGVPKGIPFDAAQDKLTPVIPMKIGVSLAEKKALSESGPPGFVWRPQGDSNPCYRRESAFRGFSH